MKRTLKAMLAAAIAAQFGTGAASAQEITLRVADHYPANSPSAAMTARYFMDEVTRRTNGRVKFEYFPAQQLGKAKDMLKLTLSGVTDIGFAAPAYVSDALPLGAVAELPGTFSHPCEGTRAFLKLARDGILREKEYAPNKVRLLIAMMLPPYQILLRTPITGLESFKGQKLRTGGGLQVISIESLGAVPVRIAGPEIYESMARGTLDGLVFPLPSLEQYKLQEHVKYSTIGMNFGSFASSYVISERKWNSLPADIRGIMDRVAVETSLHACNKMGDDMKPAIERLKAAGIQFVDLPAGDKARIKDLLSPVGTRWAKQLDDRGQPGTQVLDAFLQALKEN
ncbi:MAG: TRAP transporter substrate-binding protein DctP [Burkholderiales bacterium]|nr:MAG: TRAP transporter substrate-binding protein DctP [Burkholderiales bacterium]